MKAVDTFGYSQLKLLSFWNVHHKSPEKKTLPQKSCHHKNPIYTHPRIFTLFMKIFFTYVLWLLSQRFQNWIVARSYAHDFMENVLGLKHIDLLGRFMSSSWLIILSTSSILDWWFYFNHHFTPTWAGLFETVLEPNSLDWNGNELELELELEDMKRTIICKFRGYFRKFEETKDIFRASQGIPLNSGLTPFFLFFYRDKHNYLSGPCAAWNWEVVKSFSLVHQKDATDM